MNIWLKRFSSSANHIGSSQERHVTYDVVVFDVIGLAPCTHHECIIECNHGHDVDTFALDFVEIFNEARKVAGGTAGCECT